MAILDNIRQMPIKKRQEQRSDMFTVNVSISHDHNAVITQFLRIERFCNTHTKGDNEIFQFLKFNNFIKPGPLGIEDFSPQRQNSLEFAVPSLFCRSSCGISLNDKQL